MTFTGEKYQALIDSIPEHLRKTPEAQRIMGWVVTSWTAPLHPERARKLREEWEQFVKDNPPSPSPLWTPSGGER